MVCALNYDWRVRPTTRKAEASSLDGNTGITSESIAIPCSSQAPKPAMRAVINPIKPIDTKRQPTSQSCKAPVSKCPESPSRDNVLTTRRGRIYIPPRSASVLHGVDSYTQPNQPTAHPHLPKTIQSPADPGFPSGFTR